MDEKIVNETLIRFWDETIKLNYEDKKAESEQDIGDYKELAPSLKLFDAVSELGECKRVLDYGCGSGWASIVAAKAGCPNVTSVDLGPNIIEALSFYCSRYEVKDKVNGLVITSDWLSNAPCKTYDGIVCSNVLDVVTIDVSKLIIKELSRVAKDDAKIVIGLNFFMSKEKAKARSIDLEDGKYLFNNGVLRLCSLRDEEWANLFSPYFEVVSLEHFAWPGEPVETRRLFRLRKKAA